MQYKLNSWLDRRKSPRMPRATLGRRLAADIDGVELQIMDLSERGLKLSCAGKRHPALTKAMANGECQLTLRLPNQPVVSLRASVRYSNEARDEVTIGVAIDPREVSAPAWAAYRMALQSPEMKIAI